MQYVLIVFVVVVFAGVIIQTQVKRSRMRPARKTIETEYVVYRTRVAVKPRLSTGSWSRKTMGGMELIVRTDAIQLSLIARALGDFLGSEWLLKAPETSISMSREPSLRIYPRDWIVMRGKELDKEVEVAVSPRDHLREVWDALVVAGARAAGSPPD